MSECRCKCRFKSIRVVVLFKFVVIELGWLSGMVARTAQEKPLNLNL